MYELPENVVEVKEVFLDDASHVKDTGKLLHIFTREEQDSLRELMDCGRPDWEVLFRLYHDKKINPMSFLKSEEFLEILEKSCQEKYPYTAFAECAVPWPTYTTALFSSYNFFVASINKE